MVIYLGALYWVTQSEKRSHDDDMKDDFGFMMMKTTRAKYSYGIAIDKKCNTDIASDVKRKKDRGEGDIVENAFSMLVSRNEEYYDGYKMDIKYWIKPNVDKLSIPLYASEDPMCKYIYSENPSNPGKFDVLETKEGRAIYKVKEFTENIEPTNEKREFKLTLVYRQDGISLNYIHPTTKQKKDFHVDTTAKPDSGNNQQSQPKAGLY